MCIVQCALCNVHCVAHCCNSDTIDKQRLAAARTYTSIGKTPIGPAALTISYSLGLRGIVCTMSYILILARAVLFIPTSKNHKNSTSAKLLLPIHAPTAVGIVE